MTNDYRNSLKKALIHFEKIIEINPTPETWYQKAIVLGKLGQYQGELEAYNKAIELKPDFIEAWFNKAMLLCILGREEEGIANARLKELIPNAPKDWFYKMVFNLKIFSKELKKFEKEE